VKQLDCCTSRLSASKSSESVANIFDNFFTTTATTTTTEKSKRLIKNNKKKEKGVEKEDKAMKVSGDNVNSTVAAIPKEDKNVVKNIDAADKANNPAAVEDLDIMSLSSGGFSVIFREEEMNEKNILANNNDENNNNNVMDIVNRNTTGIK